MDIIIEMLQKLKPFKVQNMVLVGVDALAIVFSLWFAMILRFDAQIPLEYSHLIRANLLLFLISGLLFYFLFQFYEQVWRYASLPQFINLVFGTITQTGLLVLYHQFFVMKVFPYRFPYSVYLMYWMLTFLITTGVRVSYRLISRSMLSIKSSSQNEHKMEPATRVMIIGAGDAGMQLIRDLKNHNYGRKPVVVIDDNMAFHRLKVLGVPVYGGRNQILDAAERYRVNQIIIAIPSASRQTLREIVAIAQQVHCPLMILPSMSELMSSTVGLNDLKEVEIEDLLRRDEIKLDQRQDMPYLQGEVVLVTGGGGSIGSELCRQIARFQPRQLIILDIYENSTFMLEQELLNKYNDALNLTVLIGSIRDEERLKSIFTTYRPSVVFHAAAHKHVPLMETSPGEAVKNNLFGTYLVARTAAESGVRHFVMISTDKAVRPTNIMGATKRLAEIVMQGLSRRYPQTNFAAVRFGNVLGSNGSVIPIFLNQIKTQRKVTVTHPEISRYFMTIPEAVNLVIQAGSFARGGEIFVLDMGQPVKILDLAKDLILLSGLQPEIDVQIEFTGLRPGEKMTEELFLNHEEIGSTDHDKIMLLNPVVNGAQLQAEIDTLLQLIAVMQPEIRQLLADVLAE